MHLTREVPSFLLEKTECSLLMKLKCFFPRKSYFIVVEIVLIWRNFFVSFVVQNRWEKVARKHSLYCGYS